MHVYLHVVGDPDSISRADYLNSGFHPPGVDKKAVEMLYVVGDRYRTTNECKSSDGENGHVRLMQLTYQTLGNLQLKQ